MRLRVTPGAPLRGEIRVAADKSISHRAVIFAGLARGRTRLRNLSHGEDVRATVAAFRAMGVGIEADGRETTVDGVGLRGLRRPPGALDMGNSGTAMRLLAGLLCAQPWASKLTGDASLNARPMARIIEPLTKMGARIASASGGRPPLAIAPAARLRGIDYAMPVASAQVKSALLLAGLYAAGATTVTAPAATRDHTERMLAAFGAPVFADGERVGVRGDGAPSRHPRSLAPSRHPRSLAPSRHPRSLPSRHPRSLLSGGGDGELALEVPGDLSAAAFFLVGASVIEGSEVCMPGVGVNPTRSGVVTILRRMGAAIELREARVVGGEPVADLYARAAALRGCAIDAGDVALAIDEIPAIAVAAACAEGTTTIRGAAELRVKESDRISGVAAGLAALGVAVEELPDGLTITGGRLRGGATDSRGDHRLAMAFAIAGGAAAGPVQVADCANIATSFPGFCRAAQGAGLALEILDA